MAKGKLIQSEANVQRLLNDKDAMRKMVENAIQNIVKEEFEAHMGRKPYERGNGRATHRNGFKERTLTTRVGVIYLRVPQARDGSFSPSVYDKYQRVEKALFLALVETYRLGVATRKIKKITEELCGDRIPSSTISAWHKELDDELAEFLERHLEGDYPYVLVDAQVHRVRSHKKVISESVFVAEGIRESGHREVLGVSMGNSENEQSWKDFFLALRKRGLNGVDTIVSDDHKGLVNAAMLCFQGSQWQRCQFHFGRNVRKHLPKKMHSEVHRRLRSIWDAPDRETADLLLQKALDYYKNRKDFCNWLEENIEDTLTIFNLPPEHRRRLRTTNGVERMHEEVKRRTTPVRIFPNRDSALRLIGSIWQDIHEKWITGKRYLNMEALQMWEEEQEKKEVETSSMEC